jgi:RNA polymerase sigma-70 factor, ECF subfamily
MNNDSTGDWSAARTPSPSLLQRVRDKDRAAWDRLVDLYGPLVFLWCRRAGLNREDAEDVVQDVWTAVATHIAGFRRQGPEDSFHCWLRTIANNKIRDRWRDSELQGAGGTPNLGKIGQLPDQATDSGELVLSEREIVVRQAVGLIRPEFEDRTWKAFWSVTVDGRPAADVAAELKMTVGAVYQAGYRVRRRLGDEMQGLLD